MTWLQVAGGAELGERGLHVTLLAAGQSAPKEEPHPLIGDREFVRRSCLLRSGGRRGGRLGEFGFFRGSGRRGGNRRRGGDRGCDLGGGFGRAAGALGVFLMQRPADGGDLPDEQDREECAGKVECEASPAGG